MSEDAGRLVGKRYRLGGVLGRGGMGTVWRAEDEILGRTVAVKELRFPASVDEDEKQRLITRTLREAKAIARIRSGSAVTVFDVVQEDDRPWIIMELVEGRSLADHIREDGPLEPQRAAEVGLSVLDVLRAAHREGILHRDVKPSNVLLEDGTGRVVLTDFGIAKVEGDPSVTSTGMLVGAPSYISPERARGKPPGPPADLWSLGGLLFAAVEGRPPYDRGSAISTLTAVMTEPVPEPERAGGLREVIFGLLAKEPDERLDVAAAEALLRPVAAGEKPGDPEAPVVADATRSMALPPEPEKSAKSAKSGKAAKVAQGPKATRGANGSAGKATSAASGAESAQGGGKKAGSGAGDDSDGKGGAKGATKAGAQDGPKTASAGAGTGAAAASPSAGRKGLPEESSSGAGRKSGEQRAARAAAGTAASGTASAASGPASASGSAPASRAGSASERGTGSGPGTGEGGPGTGASGAGASGGGASGAGASGGGPLQALQERFSRRTLAAVAAVVVAVVVLVGAVALSTAGGDEKSGSAQQGAGAADDAEGSGGSGAEGGGEEAGSQPEAGPSAEAGKKDDDQGDQGDADDADGGDDGSSGEKAGKPAGPNLPEGYEKVVDDRFHFAVAMPEGFARAGIAGTNSGARYADPDRALPKLQIDFNASPLDDAAAAWRDLEPSVQGRSTAYRRLSLESVDWRGYPTVADWQFLREENGTKVRVLNRGFKVDGSHGYAIMITCAAGKWDDKECKTLRETAFKNFAPQD